MIELPSIYVETTIPSFLTSRLSSDLILAGEQEVTRKWWKERKSYYRLFVSVLVIEEANRGDVDAARRRLEAIEGIPLLSIDERVIELTNKIVDSGVIPTQAAADAAHIALATRFGLDYLLTWNCKHIANAEIIRRLSYEVSRAGYFLPIICTPLELFGVNSND